MADDGEGEPAGETEAIFNRFHQASPSDRRGLGLGLYIVKSIVLAHGGTIGVECPGHDGTTGRTFRFTLPAVTPT